MPTYGYECKSCGHGFDFFQSMKDDPLKLCPECGKEQLRRLINGGSGIIFKGGGFYVTDKCSGSCKSGSAESKPKTGSENSACANCSKAPEPKASEHKAPEPKATEPKAPEPKVANG